MSDFKWRHFQGEIILWAVRWYCRYGVGYRDLEQMMGERGVAVDHSTIYRWVQKYAPEIEKRLRWHWRRPHSTSWRVDETYVKVRGQWTYLYRAVDKFGNTIDFYLSPTRNAKAAKRFLGKALNGLKDWEKPTVINTDKAPTYGIAIAQLKTEGKCPENLVHRQVKYLNNVVEADHGTLKQLIKPVRGFKTLKSAYATIKGFEVMRALRKGQAAIFNLTGDFRGEARISTRNILTPITPNDRTWNAFSLNGDEAVDEYQEWLSQFGTPDMVDRDNHQFGGFPQALQNGLQARSQLAANGLNCGGREAWKTDAAEELLKSAKDWRLVIQIGGGPHAGILQPGAYYVIMREQDIVARRFDRAWVTYQCY